MTKCQCRNYLQNYSLKRFSTITKHLGLTLAAPMSRIRIHGTKFQSKSEHEWLRQPVWHSLRSVLNSTIKMIALSISPNPAPQNGVANRQAGHRSNRLPRATDQKKCCHLYGSPIVQTVTRCDCKGKDLLSHEEYQTSSIAAPIRRRSDDSDQDAGPKCFRD